VAGEYLINKKALAGVSHPVGIRFWVYNNFWCSV